MGEDRNKEELIISNKNDKQIEIKGSKIVLLSKIKYKELMSGKDWSLKIREYYDKN